MKFTKNQINQIIEERVELKEIDIQLQEFKKGFPYSDITRHATLNNGVIELNDSYLDDLVNIFDAEKEKYDIIKFVPASGAASRMFKNLYSYLHGETEDISGNRFMEKFVSEIIEFAFFSDLKEKMAQLGMDIENKLTNREYKDIIETLLHDKGLNYGQLPKGLLKFHKNKNYSVTSFEEHLTEAAIYAIGKGGNANVHFTVSPEHLGMFEILLKNIKHVYEDVFNIKMNVSFSFQKASTNTIAVTHENEPFVNNDGTLFFRPGGHGALLENLNDLKADIVFVKNIDTSEDDMAVVHSISEIGHVMGKKVIAEFVSSEAVLDKVKQTNIEFGQGYAIEKPITLDQLLKG